MEIWNSLPDFVRSTIWIVVVMVCLILSVAFTTLWERKVIGWMQLRKGPNRVGSLFGFLPGILQPFADVIKLLVKEVVVPTAANKVLFRIAPMITLIPAFAFPARWIGTPRPDRLAPAGTALRARASGAHAPLPGPRPGPAEPEAPQALTGFSPGRQRRARYTRTLKEVRP